MLRIKNKEKFGPKGKGVSIVGSDKLEGPNIKGGGGKRRIAGKWGSKGD